MKNTRPLEPLVLLTDEPIREVEHDGLGLENWARVVAGAALGTDGPFTIGIFGPWGAGKTSILRLAQRLIDTSEPAQRGEITTIAFNAWQHEQESVPLIPLVASIVYGLKEGKGIAKELKEQTSKLHDALRSLLFGLSTKVSGKVPLIGEASLTLDSNKAIERYETLRSQWIDQEINNSLYYKSFQALQEAVENREVKRHRVAVFIDDLDRCFPDKAIQLLESIKLALGHPGFVFIVAVDRRPLEAFLNKRYNDEFGMKDYNQGQSYLDKIIQLPMWIPPHETRFEYMTERLLDTPALDARREAFEPLIKIIGLACEFNPRQLIRLFNDILVGWRVYQLAKLPDEFPLGAFLISHGIRHQSDHIYQGLISDRLLCDTLKGCSDMSSIQESLDTLIRQKDREAISSFLPYLRTRLSLLRLLISDSGREWLADHALRFRVDSFLTAGWKPSQTDLEAVEWIKAQVARALEQLGSGNQNDVLAACHTLQMLGDRTSIPTLKTARTKWKGNSKVGRAISVTYQKLMQSFEGSQS